MIAAEEIIEQLMPTFSRAAYRLARPGVEAEDLLQEAALRALEIVAEFPELEDEHLLKLCSVAGRNRMRSACSREATVVRHIAPLISADGSTAYEPTYYDRILLRELRGILSGIDLDVLDAILGESEALASLAERERGRVALARASGESVRFRLGKRHIAEALGVSRNQVAKSFQRIGRIIA